MVKNFRWLIVLAILFFWLSGCPKGLREEGTLNVWVHSGQPSERQTIEQQVKRFNANHKDITVKLTMLPEGYYNAQVQAAAISGGLPDLLEFDGPFVYNGIYV